MLGRLSIQARTVVLTALVGLTMLVLAAWLLLQNAEEAIEAEIKGNLRLTRDYVIAAVGSLRRDHTDDEVMSFLPTILFQPRHAKITIIDLQNNLIHVPEPPPTTAAEEHAAPDWFYLLLRNRTNDLILPIRFGQSEVGRVVISAQPDDEIDEIWEDFRDLTVLGAASFLVFLGILTLLLRQALAPLTRMTDRIEQLRQGDYSTRIGAVPVPELNHLAQHFDQLGADLGATLQEKDRLARTLMQVQDQERKSIAMELHDDFGPCLFGLRVEARALTDMQLPEDARQSAQSIAEIVDRIDRINRSLLRRVHPVELDTLPLSEVLTDLIDRFRDLAPQILWDVMVDDDLDDPEDVIELTVFRVVQEALTNALRHAEADQISVSVVGLPQSYRIRVKDNGKGMPGDRPGMGLSGLKDRVTSVAGQINLLSRPMDGTEITVTLPRSKERPS